MSHHIIVGAGPIGTTLANHLHSQGHTVSTLTRHSNPSVDATDSHALSHATRTADVIYNCVNPTYHRWPQLWPQLNHAFLTAAETNGAVLVTAANLYGYGPHPTPMTESTPPNSTEPKGRTRNHTWTQSLDWHNAGRVRVTEVRGSDYIGPHARTTAHAGSRLLQPLLAGKPLRPLGSSEQPHTWTYLPDFAAALAAAAQCPDAWGKPWHAPSPSPRTYRELATGLAIAANVTLPRISPVPISIIRVAGIVLPFMREVSRVGYQFTQPFVMDSQLSQQVLGVTPSSWDTINRETVAWWRSMP